jgi:hypothetical protein
MVVVDEIAGVELGVAPHPHPHPHPTPTPPPKIAFFVLPQIVL